MGFLDGVSKLNLSNTEVSSENVKDIREKEYANVLFNLGL